MNTIAHRIEKLIRADAWRMGCLETARAAGLHDWLIVAGFVRNLIWDRLHCKPVATPLTDVDLVFFDASHLSIDTEKRIEASLAATRPDIQWQVRNQARMHLRNGHPPYKNTEDAISYYPELETCIGVRLSNDGSVQVVAPHGMEQHWALTIQPNPKSAYAMSVVQGRATEKRWLEIWPRLQMKM